MHPTSQLLKGDGGRSTSTDDPFFAKIRVANVAFKTTCRDRLNIFALQGFPVPMVTGDHYRAPPSGEKRSRRA